MKYDDDSAWNDDSSGKDEGRDYEVGYGKPPLHSRFRKGLSGNPKGRKKELNDLERIRDLVKDKVEVTIDGEKRKITVREALIRSTMAKALKGNISEARRFVALLSELGMPLVSAEDKSALDGSQYRAAMEQFAKIRREILAIDPHHDLMKPYRQREQALIFRAPDVIERQIDFWVKFLEEASDEVDFKNRLTALKAERRFKEKRGKLVKQITRRYRERNGNTLEYKK